MKPEILIGIPTLNGPERLGRCLESIRRHTPLEAYQAQVLVSDDYSFKENLEENRKICQNFKVELACPAQVRIGVAQQWNCLTRHTEAPIVILMNDDVEVVEDWLEVLVFSIRNNLHAGMIGLKAYQGVTSKNFTPPPIQSYNEAVMEHGLGMISATGFLFGFERRKWEEVGGFDPHFFAFYEELDFSIELIKRNWLPYMLSYPIVIHQGGATTSDVRNLQAQAVMAESRALFKSKHGSIEQVRRTLLAGQAWPKTVHWNTMLKTWVD